MLNLSQMLIDLYNSLISQPKPITELVPEMPTGEFIFFEKYSPLKTEFGSESGVDIIYEPPDKIKIKGEFRF